jgi:hypothetical protein
MNKAKAAVSGRIAQGTAAKLFWPPGPGIPVRKLLPIRHPIPHLL